MTAAEAGVCMCAHGESVGFVFKILNLLFALSPAEVAAWIASGPPISVQSLVVRSQAYLFDFMLVLLICFSAAWSAEGQAIRGRQWHKPQLFLQWFDFWFINSGKRVAVTGCVNSCCNYSCGMAKGRDANASPPSNALFCASEEMKKVTGLYDGLLRFIAAWPLKKGIGVLYAYVLKYLLIPQILSCSPCRVLLTYLGSFLGLSSSQHELVTLFVHSLCCPKALPWSLVLFSVASLGT